MREDTINSIGWCLDDIFCLFNILMNFYYFYDFIHLFIISFCIQLHTIGILLTCEKLLLIVQSHTHHRLSKIDVLFR
jgi:hypothetical protein